MEKIVFVVLLTFVFAGCGTEKEKKVPSPAELRIGFWNVQALFDAEETGTEYAEYRNTTGWTDEKYRARLTALGQGIETMSEEPPDILGLVEIENPQVLEDLVQGLLEEKGKKGKKYQWMFFGTNPGAALGIGVVSRFPFEQTLLHSITVNGKTAPRPMLEIRLQVNGSPLICFVCHWKAKTRGDAETEALRKASARLIVRRLRELKQESPEIPVLIMGDLNENHDEFYRTSGSVLSALLPDAPEVAEYAETQTDFLILSRNKPPKPEHVGADALVLYSPWGTELEEGSYYFRETWETIDHFLLSPGLFDQTGWEFRSCRVVKEPLFLKGATPYGYNPRTGGGLSDHLPLLLTLFFINPAE